MFGFMVVIFFLGMSIGFAICIPITRAHWQRGVKEGYGYGRECRNVEFMEAGTYLRDHCWEQWPELRDDNKMKIHRVTQYHEKWEDN